jgi:uncharacterized protein
MRLLFLFLFITISLFTNAQTKNSGEITATGMAKMKVKPDVAVITFTIEKQDRNESVALKNINQEAERLSEILSKSGFGKDQIKVSRYSVSSNTYQEEKVFNVTNSLVVQFILDKKIIDNVYSAVEAEKLNDVNIDLETKLSDSLEKSVRARLILLAIQDAQLSATNIAKALNVRVGKVKQVSKYGDIMFDVNKVGFANFAGSMANAVQYKTTFNSYDVLEVEIQEQITIIFEIM